MTIITNISFNKKYLHYTFKGPRLVSYTCLDYVAGRGSSYVILYTHFLGVNIERLPFMIYETLVS